MKTWNRVALTAALVILAAAPAPGSASYASPRHTRSAAPAIDWKQFQLSANKQGFNPVERTITRSNVQQLALKYIAVMDPTVESLIMFSSAAVVDDVAYIGSTDGRLYAFPATGCGAAFCPPLWTARTDNSLFSSPAVVDGVVYVGSSDHKLYAFDAAGCPSRSCQPLWTGTTAQGILQSAPVVAEGLVFVGSFDGRLYAFPQDGCGSGSCSPVWMGPTDEHIASSPAYANGKVYVTSYDDETTVGTLRVFDAAGCGSLICSPDWSAVITGSALDGGPSVVNGSVYVSSFYDGKLEVFDADGCGAATCPPVWTAPAGTFPDATPTVARGLVYVTSGDGNMYVYDSSGCGQATCQPLWAASHSGTFAASISPPVVAGNVVYMTEMNAHVYAYRASGCRRSVCQPLWSAQVEDQVVSAAPVVVNGRLYVGSSLGSFPSDQGRLYVYTLNGQ